MRLIFTIAFSSLFSIAAAATYNVTLGKGGQDVFDPNSYVGVSPAIDDVLGLMYECEQFNGCGLWRCYSLPIVGPLVIVVLYF